MEEDGVGSRRVRSRSCGAVTESDAPSAASPDARRKCRRTHPPCCQKRRMSAGGAGEARDNRFDFHQSDGPRPSAKVVELLADVSLISEDDCHSIVSLGDGDRMGSNCTAIATCTLAETRPTISVTDLSTVYKSLELLNGYLSLQGYSPYEGAFLNDPRVGEILSHIQHGCPLARRPSKHLPRIDSPLLPSIDWSETIIQRKSDLVTHLLERIHSYVHTDIEVLIGREVYCCHLLVLQCYSSYFEDINGAAKVHLPEDQVSGRSFHRIYNWMITTDNESYQILKRDNVLEMLLASQFLGIRELEEQCWSFINSDHIFNEETAFLLYMEARRAANTQVMELMLPRVRRFFLKLVSTVDFLTLDVDALCIILGSNYIAVHSEMEVFMSAVLWLTHDWGQRRAHVAEVMRHVRFGLIEPWQIVDIRRNYSANPEFIRVTQNPEVRRMMEEGLAFATTREACAGNARRLSELVDELCLVGPSPRHWLEKEVEEEDDDDDPGHTPVVATGGGGTSFQKFIESLPKYREPGALDDMRFCIPKGDEVAGEEGQPPASFMPPTPESSPAPTPSPASACFPFCPPRTPVPERAISPVPGSFPVTLPSSFLVPLPTPIPTPSPTTTPEPFSNP